MKENDAGLHESNRFVKKSAVVSGLGAALVGASTFFASQKTSEPLPSKPDAQHAAAEPSAKSSIAANDTYLTDYGKTAGGILAACGLFGMGLGMGGRGHAKIIQKRREMSDGSPKRGID